MLLIYFVPNWVFAFLLDSNQQDDIALVGHLTTLFGVQNIHIVCISLAHAKKDYHGSQFGY
jgi:hypothetical protein